MSKIRCPLCLDRNARFLYRSDDRHGIREFYECLVCDLAFAPPEFHLPSDAEMARYLMHNNDPNDEGYRNFLSRLWNVLRPILAVGETGLDYGCGPGPALVQMMREEGFAALKYDLYFFPNPEPLTKEYDFITCTETVEHLRKPREVFDLFDSLLKPNGKLGIMTGMLDDRSKFADWGYQRDPTHISFYSRDTMKWIARRMGWEVRFPVQNIAIFRKP